MLYRNLASAAFVLVTTLTPLAASAGRSVQPQLRDQNNHVFTLASLRGEPLVVTFVAAHCTDACPLINAQFAGLQRQMEQKHLRVRLLTITLDPDNDSVSSMRAIARTFGADSSHWILASGNVRDVRAVMRAFHVVARRGRKGYADVHTTFVYVLNGRGVLESTLLASSGIGADVIAALRGNPEGLAR